MFHICTPEPRDPIQEDGVQEVMGLCMEKARKLPTSAQHLKTEGNIK